MQNVLSISNSFQHQQNSLFSIPEFPLLIEHHDLDPCAKDTAVLLPHHTMLWIYVFLWWYFCASDLCKKLPEVTKTDSAFLILKSI